MYNPIFLFTICLFITPVLNAAEIPKEIDVEQLQREIDALIEQIDEDLKVISKDNVSVSKLDEGSQLPFPNIACKNARGIVIQMPDISERQLCENYISSLLFPEKADGAMGPWGFGYLSAEEMRRKLMRLSSRPVKIGFEGHNAGNEEQQEINDLD